MKESPEAIMEDIAKVVQNFILREFLPGEDSNELTDRTPLITGGILDSLNSRSRLTTSYGTRPATGGKLHAR